MRVPAGFEARYFARLEALPTAITFDRDGRLYVAAMDGVIYRVTPGGRISAFFSGLTVPTGLTFQPGTDRLYVTSRVNNVGVGGEAMVAVIENGRLTPVLTGLPCCYTGYHAANGISFGPDGYGYVGVGARADHGEVLDTAFQDERQWNEAVILRFSPDGREVAPYAFGLRNPYDHAWDSEGRLFATDNAPDPRPGWNAPDELHLVVPGAEHGYPWYECDLCFKPPPEQAIVPPVYEFLAHSSPTGIVAYTADAFPGYYDSLFVALWSAFPGAQKVMHFTPGGAEAGDFLVGLSSPIDLAVSPDGQLYVADFFTGIIVAIRYVG